MIRRSWPSYGYNVNPYNSKTVYLNWDASQATYMNPSKLVLQTQKYKIYIFCRVYYMFQTSPHKNTMDVYSSGEYHDNPYRYSVTKHHDICWRSDTNPDSKLNGSNMGPTWGRQDPGGAHVGHMNLVISEGPVYTQVLEGVKYGFCWHLMNNGKSF